MEERRILLDPHKPQTEFVEELSSMFKDPEYQGRKVTEMKTITVKGLGSFTKEDFNRESIQIEMDRISKLDAGQLVKIQDNLADFLRHSQKYTKGDKRLLKDAKILFTCLAWNTLAGEKDYVGNVLEAGVDPKCQPPRKIFKGLEDSCEVLIGWFLKEILPLLEEESMVEKCVKGVEHAVETAKECVVKKTQKVVAEVVNNNNENEKEKEKVMKEIQKEGIFKVLGDSLKKVWLNPEEDKLEVVAKTQEYLNEALKDEKVSLIGAVDPETGTIKHTLHKVRKFWKNRLVKAYKAEILDVQEKGTNVVGRTTRNVCRVTFFLGLGVYNGVLAPVGKTVKDFCAGTYNKVSEFFSNLFKKEVIVASA